MSLAVDAVVLLTQQIMDEHEAVASHDDPCTEGGRDAANGARSKSTESVSAVTTTPAPVLSPATSMLFRVLGVLPVSVLTMVAERAHTMGIMDPILCAAFGSLGVGVARIEERRGDALGICVV